MSKITSADAKEYAGLFWTNLVVQKRNFVEFLKVLARYYNRWSYAKIDGSLLLTYLFDNPFTISKRYLMKRGEENIYTYGETPLTTLEEIAKECQIKPADTVFELGCGRGRTCFWLRGFIGCKVVGIEYIPAFVERARRVAKKLKIDGVEFRNEDFLKSDFTGGTVFYLYGTCYEESFITQLIEKLKKSPPGTKIITVSYPLTDYCKDPLFEVMKRFPAKMTWGIADVYLQVRK